MKKISAVLLTLAMLLTLCVPVFADVSTDQTNTGNLVTREGASVRLAEPSGLRFQTEIKKEYYHSLSDVKMGTLIAPESYVEQAGAFTKAALDALDIEGAKYLDVVAGGFFDDTNPDYYVFAGSIANIKENHRDLPFAGIGYIEYQKDGKTVVEYSNRYSVRTVSNVASAALGDMVFEEGQTGYANPIEGKGAWSPYTAAQREILSSLRGNVLEIETAEQFICFANLVNTKIDDFAGKTVKLTADLDFTGVTGFQPVGNNPTVKNNEEIFNWGTLNPEGKAFFSGTFDGQGHEIKNLTASFNQGHTGLFGATLNAVIRNVHLTAQFSNTSGTWHNGLLVGLAVGTTVDSCHVSGKYESTASEIVGGVVGGAGKNTTIRNCIVDAEISGKNHVGGFIGLEYTSGEMAMENCYIKAPEIQCATEDGFYGAFVGNGHPYYVINSYAVCTSAAEFKTLVRTLSGMATLTFVKNLSADELKTKVKQLGSAFTVGSDGFPVLTYGKEVKVICSVEDWKVFAEDVNQGNHYDGVIVRLEADLDFSNVSDFVPAGNNPNLGNQDVITWSMQDSISSKLNGKYYFGGTFDGQGHKITGIKAVFNQGYTGLFGMTYGARIEGLWVEAEFTNTSRTWHNGVLVGLAIDTIIDSCYVGGKYNSTTAQLVGGIVGTAYRMVRILDSVCTVDCSSLGDMFLGGFIGYSFDGVTETALENSYLQTAAFGVKGETALLIGSGGGYSWLNRCYVFSTTLQDMNLTNGVTLGGSSEKDKVIVSSLTAEQLGSAFGTDADGNLVPKVFL